MERTGRIWHTDSACNIAFSFVVEVNSKIENFEGITVEIAEIFVKIFKEYEINVSIKAPNDLYLNGKKLGGILCQTKLVGENVRYIVIGIGINIEEENFSEDIENLATSIKKEFPNIKINRLEIISKFFNDFEKILNKKIGEK